MEESEILAGKPSFVEERGVSLTNQVRARINAPSNERKTVVVLSRGKESIGIFALQDTPRRGAQRLFEKLRQRGIKTLMLTGDAQRVAILFG